MPGDLEAWCEFCEALCQPAAQKKITPSVFAWMCVAFGVQWHPVVRHLTQLAGSGRLEANNVSAQQLYDRTVELVRFSCGKRWETMHANVGYKSQASIAGLVEFAKHMCVISHEGVAGRTHSKRRRCRKKTSTDAVKLGKGLTSHTVLTPEDGVVKFQALLDAGAKARRERSVGSGCSVLRSRRAGGEVEMT